MAARPIDARGYTVPWFVELVDGIPDHRVTSESKRRLAVRDRLCWLCGQRLGSWSTFVLGPMCSLTRTTSEPPSHHECAEWAVRACPFLTRPHAHRRTAGLPDDVHEAPGCGLKRNPGMAVLWSCAKFQSFNVEAELGIGGGMLLRIGEPLGVEWYTEGRAATPDELRDTLLDGVVALAHNSGASQHEAAEVYSDLAPLWMRLVQVLAVTWPAGACALVEATPMLPMLVTEGLIHAAIDAVAVNANDSSVNGNANASQQGGELLRIARIPPAAPPVEFSAPDIGAFQGK